MQTIHTLTLWTHVLFGSVALMLFWIPMTAPKGRLNHVKFGRFYNWAMYTVAATGAITALMVLWDPLAIHGERLSDPAYTQIFVDKMRVFYGLLFYLSILVYVSLRHGILTLKYKQDNSQIRQWDVLAGNGALITGAPVLFWLGWQFDQTLPLIFSVLGLVTGITNLMYIFAKSPSPKAWLKEHIGAMIGSGIAAHTAFLAFGGRSLFHDIGNYQLIFWIATGVIGSFAIRRFSLKYAPGQKIKNLELKAR